MHNLSLLEESFKKFFKSIVDSHSESTILINLARLHEMDLLHYHSKRESYSTLTRYFQVIETSEKITLINDEFVIWIVPEKVNEKSLTYTLIALNHQEGPHLELAFITSGVYNTSQLVLRILEKFLFEIQENEDYLNQIKYS